MLQISPDSLQDGCERAHDLFLLNRLRSNTEAAASFDSVFEALGMDNAMRERLQHAVAELVPVKGVPPVEAIAEVSILAGVLVGLLIADSATPAAELDLPVIPS